MLTWTMKNRDFTLKIQNDAQNNTQSGVMDPI